MKQKPKTCAHCGDEFTPERRNGIYCSQTCRQYSYLSRKTGEVYGLPKKENEKEDFSNVPALVIEEEEEKKSISVNETQPKEQSPPIIYQLKDKKESTQNVNWNYSANVNTVNKPSQQNQLMKTETTTQRHNEEQNAPVLIIDQPNVAFESETNDSEQDEFIPKKTYADYLDDQKQHANSDLSFWWDMCKPSKSEKAQLFRFGNRIKPFLKSLLMMDGKQVPIKSLYGWKIEANKIVSTFFPNDECPIFYPPLGFFAGDLLINMDEFIKSIEPLRVKTARVRLSDRIKSEAEIAVKIIDSFTPNAPEYWVLP